MASDWNAGNVVTRSFGTGTSAPAQTTATAASREHSIHAREAREFRMPVQPLLRAQRAAPPPDYTVARPADV